MNKFLSATNGPECQIFLQRLSDLPECKAQLKRAGANERNENWTRDPRGSDSDGHWDTAMDGRPRGGLQVFPTDQWTRFLKRNASQNISDPP